MENRVRDCQNPIKLPPVTIATHLLVYRRIYVNINEVIARKVTKICGGYIRAREQITQLLGNDSF
jgi:hypothetical protein